MIKLYGHEVSGNTYKARLLLSLLKIEHEYVQIDLMKGAHKSPEYLELNPFGQVPTLQDEELVFQDAQAILVYLARRYGDENWLPNQAEPMSRVMRWLSTTAGELRQGPEHARLYHLFGVKRINIERATEQSNFILKQIDHHLRDRNWLELNHPTIADIAAFPYIALAPEGKISLQPYTNVAAWIERVKGLPGFVGMRGIEAPLTA